MQVNMEAAWALGRGVTKPHDLRPIAGGEIGESGRVGDEGEVLRAVRDPNPVRQLADGESLRVGESRPGETHDEALALRRAEISIQLALSLRDKLVQAYEELMRTPV